MNYAPKITEGRRREAEAADVAALRRLVPCDGRSPEAMAAYEEALRAFVRMTPREREMAAFAALVGGSYATSL